MATDTKFLGIGVYTPEEAAFYARVQTRLLNRWLFGNKQGPSVVDPQLRDQSERDEKIVTFLDFVQMLAIRDLRLNYKVPLQTIREGVKEFEETYSIQYPFARRHVAFLFQRGPDDRAGGLYIRQPGDDGESIYTKVTGTTKGKTITKGQMALTKLVQFYMRDMHFDPDGLAESFDAFSQPYDGKVKKVIMHPQKRFGEPLVESCGVSAQTLYEASISEGGIEAAAYVYEVEPEDVDIARRYIDYITPPSGEQIAA